MEKQKQKSTSPPEQDLLPKGIDLLPKEIIIEILSRLPITSITHFKLTSKSGRELAADQRLPAMFLHQVTNSDPSLIMINSISGSISSIPKQLYFLDTHPELGFVKIARKINPPNPPISKIDFVGCCNGLLCITIPKFFYSYEVRGLRIWNPFSANSQPLDLPIPNRFMNQREIFGFGFNPSSKEFKVIRIVFYELIMTGQDGMVALPKSEVQVLTIGKTEWRKKGASPYEFDRKTPDALVAGSLHWVVAADVEQECGGVISFDLEEELFRKIPLPDHFDQYYTCYHVTVVEGCLAVAGFSPCGRMDVWIMKVYNVKESWVLGFSVLHEALRRVDQQLAWCWSRKLVKVLCVLKNGDVVMEFDEKFLVSYDTGTNRFNLLDISRLPEGFRASVFRPSLFSVKETIEMKLL